MATDQDLNLRGRLIRRLGALREMLPGSFVERRRKCGKPSCHCADGKQLHSAFQISVLRDGKLQTFHIPAELAEEARTTQIRRILTLGDRAEGLSDAGFPAFVYPEPYLTVG
jgi:hypothetical protein